MDGIKYKLSGSTWYTVHDTWEDAATQAVDNGWAYWENKHELKLHEGVEIKAIREETNVSSAT